MLDRKEEPCWKKILEIGGGQVVNAQPPFKDVDLRVSSLLFDICYFVLVYSCYLLLDV